MGVLDYIKAKFKKSEAAYKEKMQFCHKKEQCNCNCHKPSSGMMHIRACCMKAVCEHCGKSYNKKNNLKL